MISDLWSCMSRSTTQPCWWLPWLLGVPSTLQGDSLLYNADFKLSLGVPSTLKKWLVHNHHEFWSTDEKVEKDLEFTWIQRRSIVWSSSLTDPLSFAPVYNNVSLDNKQVYLFVLANDEGTNEDIDGKDDDADGDNEDGEGVNSEALGGVEHVGARGERYVPLAKERKNY